MSNWADAQYHAEQAERQKVFAALAQLGHPSWLLALSAMRGVIREMGEAVNPDPTAEVLAVKAIDREIVRLESL